MGSSKLQYYFERMEIFLLVDFQSLVGSFWELKEKRKKVQRLKLRH